MLALGELAPGVARSVGTSTQSPHTAHLLPGLPLPSLRKPSVLGLMNRVGAKKVAPVGTEVLVRKESGGQLVGPMLWNQGQCFVLLEGPSQIPVGSCSESEPLFGDV